MVEGLRTPIGDQPPEVYWRRRLTVVGGLILLILVIWFLVTSPSGESDPDAPAPSVTPTVEPTSTADPGPATSAGACGPDDISISLVATPFSVGPDGLPTFEATVEHTGAVPCSLDTGASNSDLYIRSGGDAIFYASHCPESSPISSRQFLLADGATETFAVTWNRQRSAENCGSNTGDVLPGFYMATLTLQGIAADEAQFELVQ